MKTLIKYSLIFLVLVVIIISLAYFINKNSLPKEPTYIVTGTFNSVTGYDISDEIRPTKKFCFKVKVDFKYNNDTIIIKSDIFESGFKPLELSTNKLILKAIDKNGTIYEFHRSEKDGLIYFFFKRNLIILNPKSECFIINN